MLMVYLPLVIARWIHFASVFVLFGSSFFWFYQGAERSSAGPGGLPRAVRATTILLRIAAPIAAISGVGWLACILINMARDFHSVVDPEDLRLFFFETPFGTVSFARLALLTIGVVIAFLPWSGRWRFAALVPVSALLLVTQAWFGHSAEGVGLYRAIMITVYGIHALATAAWVGGLPPLLFALILLLQVFYGIRSERQLMEQLDYNLLYRWFAGLAPDDPVWDTTTFTKEPGSTAARRGVSKVHDEAFESPAGEAAFVGRAFFGGWDFDRGLGIAEELSGQGRRRQ